MSFLSKLLGNNEAAQSTLNSIKKAAQDLANEAAEKLNNGTQPVSRPVENRPYSEPARSAQSEYDYYEDVPAEENQYNFNGSYIQYFEKIFREDFPAYEVRMEQGLNSCSPLFVFYSGGRQALVVELKSQSSEAQKIRRSCESSGIPYLRFYYDHEGWWNTRSYVTQRVRSILNG